MISWLVGHVLALGIGVSLGLLGGGGSVLALPVLVYVLGIAPKVAIAMTLAIIGLVSLLGIIPHWKQGNVQIKTALIFGSATMVGAFGGARIATLPIVSATFQMLLFAGLMLLAAMLMIRRSAKVPASEEIGLYPPPICRYCWLWLMTEGIFVGVLTGLVGVGGGFAIVPALVLLGKMPIRQAIGTSLLIITMNSAAGFLGYLGHVSVDWVLVFSFALVASVGTLLGARWSRKFHPHGLQKGFAYFLLAVASFVLFQNRHVLTRSASAFVSQGQVQRYSSLSDQLVKRSRDFD